ncbi:MAG: zf-HC2 domain-containing protein [Acidobacteriota bacterium]
MSTLQQCCEHMSLDGLSAYLDQELPPEEAEKVELHLSGCEQCQRRLEGLRSVVGGLRDLERLQPPPFVEEALRHEISLQAKRRSVLWQRLDRLAKPRSFNGPLFAMILALATIVLLFSVGLERASQPATEVIVPPPGEPSRQIADRVFTLVYRGDGEEPPSQLWIERGARLEEARPLDPGSVEALALFEALPQLEQILNRDVVLLWADGTVRLSAGQSVQTEIDSTR